MCRGAEHVADEAMPLLAEILADIAKSLDPEHPERVVVGPVDFGTDDYETNDPPHAWWAGIPMDELRSAEAAAFGVTLHTENLQGQRVAAVEVQLDGVNYGGGTIYLDDRDGTGTYKVTAGRGSPRIGHAELPLIDVEDRVWCPTSLDGSPSGCRCRD